MTEVLPYISKTVKKTGHGLEDPIESITLTVQGDNLKECRKVFKELDKKV